MNDRQERLYQLLDQYNNGVEPIESWVTGDIVKLINLLDEELQERYERDSARDVIYVPGPLDINAEDDYEEDSDVIN